MPAIHTGHPSSVIYLMGVNVMHSRRIPPRAATCQYWVLFDFLFAITRTCQFGCLECSNKKPVFQRLEVRQSSEGDARLFELVRAAERGVEAGVYWPNDGSIWCGGCPFTQACARWHENPDAFRSHSEK